MATLCQSAAEAVAAIQPHQSIYIHGMAATPKVLVDALAEHARTLEGLRLVHLHCEDLDALCDVSLQGHVYHHCYFIDKHTRPLLATGMADYAPVFLSEVPKLFRSRVEPIDAVLLQVSPPNKHGFCSLGVSVEAARAACEVASIVIAHINPQMPVTHGDAFIHINDISFAYEESRPVYEKQPGVPDDVSKAIGQHVAELIPDGACLQTGIGAIPDAVLACLGDHKHLGVHTEMFSDGVISLVENGIIDNSRKKTHPGKLVTGFALGSRALYDFVDDNPECVFLDSEYINDTSTIRRNPGMIAINSALEVDITGQVCADSIGSTIYSGFGGQMDFVRGASLSPDGKAIIALPSTAAGGTVSRISHQLRLGSGVVTTRAHVQYIVTEYGVADLRGKSLRERAQALINIAHPTFREELKGTSKKSY